RRALFHRLVATHPDRTETEHRDLPGVPVLQSIESKDLGKLADPPRVPTRVGGAVSGWGAHGGEDLFACHELEKIGVPYAVVIVALQPAFAFGFEELDRAAHDRMRALVGIRAHALLRIQKDLHRDDLRGMTARHATPRRAGGQVSRG